MKNTNRYDNLLQYTSTLYGETRFENVSLIACQHLLSSTHFLLKHLINKGLKKENIFLIGKCYSTAPEIYHSLIEAQINTSKTSNEYDSHSAYDDQLKRNIINFLKSIPEQKEHIIILDDGGYLICEVNQFIKNKIWSNKTIFGIEQTASGITLIQKQRICFPVINIGKNLAKTSIETEFILSLAIQAITRKEPSCLQEKKKLLIMGNGILGQKLYSRLNHRHDTDIFDINTERTCIPEERLDLSKYDIILGASGSTSIPQKDHLSLKKGCLLISISSSDREFDSVYLRRKVPQNNNCHADLKIDGIHLINSGFPVNFDDNKYGNISIQKIQITLALLLAAMYEAISRKNLKNGLNHLDIEKQKAIRDRFISYE